MRALMLGVVFLAPAALAAEVDQKVYFANAGIVTDLCRSAMTPPDATPEVTKQFEGLCDCAMSGILALNKMDTNAPFLAVWADLARWRDANAPVDLAAAQFRAEGAIYVHYRDMKKGRAEIARYGDMAITLTQICSDGYASSGMEPPEFSIHAFYEGFARQP